MSLVMTSDDLRPEQESTERGLCQQEVTSRLALNSRPAAAPTSAIPLTTTARERPSGRLAGGGFMRMKASRRSPRLERMRRKSTWLSVIACLALAVPLALVGNVAGTT